MDRTVSSQQSLSDKKDMMRGVPIMAKGVGGTAKGTDPLREAPRNSVPSVGDAAPGRCDQSFAIGGG